MEKMLDRYIYDYMLQRNLHSSASAFLTEGNVRTDREVVDVPGGLLFRFWSKYWDNGITRSNRKGSDSTAAHIEVQMQNPSSQMAPKQNYRKRKQCSNQIMQQSKARKQQQQKAQTLLQSSRDPAEDKYREYMELFYQHYPETFADLMGANRMGLPKSTFNHQGQMMQGNFGSMSASFKQMQGLPHLASMEMAALRNPFSQMAPKQNNRKRKQYSNQIDNLETLGNAGFLEDNVDTVLLPDGGAGVSLVEVGCIRTENKLTCCHFSSDGKFLAIAGHGKKAVLWNMNTLGIEHTLEQHQGVITDVRFRPESTQLATSSLDKSVRIWDAANPGYCVHAYTTHPSHIMSLDFHPSQNDLFCFCDTNHKVHYWSVNPFSCIRISKQRGRAYVRFQPINGHLLATITDNVVSIYDVESDKQTYCLQGHTGAVGYLCWDINGDRLASVSRDRIKIWSVASGECIRELINEDGKRFHCCVFHPLHSHLLVMGGLRCMELWNMNENKMVPMPAHEEIVVALAQSPQTMTIASAGRDGIVKLWR